MSCNQIIMKEGHKVALPVTTREEYLALRGSDKQKRIMSAIRNAKSPQEKDKLKMRLQQFNYSGYYPDGLIKGNRLCSKAFGYDVDDVAVSEEVLEKLLDEDGMPTELATELRLLMAERSAKGGVHLIFEREMGKTILENQVRIAVALHCEMDNNCHEVNRVYFTSTDLPEDLLYLSDELFADAFDEAARSESEMLERREKEGQEDLPADAHKSNKHYRPWESSCKGSDPLHDENEKQEKMPMEITDTYLGIPYAEIIRKYWEMFYAGQEPVTSNRDTLTYELANVMKHICGYDRALLDHVIPCYDGFSEEQKLKCIDSALSGRKTQMPKRLREVLQELRRSQLISGPSMSSGHLSPIGENGGEAFDEVFQEDALFHYNRIQKPLLCQGIKDSLDAAGHELAMPVINSMCTCVGARATWVKLDIHGKSNYLNLLTYVSGDSASNKGQIDDVVDAWMAEDKAMAEMYNRQWKEWAQKMKKCKNKKELPEEPIFPKVWLPMNNTPANLAELLARTEDRHGFSFTPEADVVTSKWKGQMGEFSAMARQAYDASSYDREAKSVDAVNVHIKRLKWNIVMAGTPDALYRMVANYTDGLQTRLALSRTPDNTYTPLEDEPAHMTDLQRERIYQVSHLLPLMSGEIVLPKLEETGRQWLEEIRLEAMKNADEVMARQRFRICVIAQRMTCCLMLVGVCAKLIRNHGANGAETRLKQDPELWKRMTESMQTPSYLNMYALIADSLMENALFYFRDRIQTAVSSSNYRSNALASMGGYRRRKGVNDTIFSRLGNVFSFNEAMQQTISEKGAGVSRNAVQQMLKNWQRQKLITAPKDGRYSKVKS